MSCLATLDLFAAATRPQEAPATLNLRPYQQGAREAVETVHMRSRGALVCIPTGCHRAGQLIMLHSGVMVPVEAVQVGDLLMGPDGTHRTVLQLARGHDEMVEIRPTKGDPWVVNLDHILTLVSTTSKLSGAPSQRGGQVVDVSVREWFGWSKSKKHVFKLFRVPVADFGPRPEPKITPYVLGALLGDGHITHGVEAATPDREIWGECRAEAERWGLRFVEVNPENRCPHFRLSGEKSEANPLMSELRALGVNVLSEDKFVPEVYRLGSRDVRREVLAGLLDTDGHMTSGGYDFVSKSQRLAHDVAFIARSLGLAAYVKECRKGCQTGAVGTYHRVSISGECSLVPCRVERKKAPPRGQKKSALRTGFTVHRLRDTEDYYGFALDGDQRYLLGDFTVTHNTGKTRLAGAVAWDHKLRGSKVLVTCPTIVLCHQMYDSLRALGLSCSIEQADNHVRWPLPDVTVASVATLRGVRLKQFPPTTFGLVCADEAHRSVSASQLAIFEHFAPAKRLGLTATPDRVDGMSLANVFDEVAYEMSMLQAIQDGWLVPLRFKTAVTDFDAKRLRTIGGEVSAGSVEAEIMRCGLLHEAANTLAELASGERTVAFLPTVAASKAFVGELLARGMEAAHVDGTTSTDVRNLAFERFKRGEVRVLSNVGICVEGWDMPEASVIALLNPTKSRSRITQMIGRCTRLAAGKTHALVIDFCPGRMRKGRLASPADALAGKMLDDDTHRHLAKSGDLAKAISDAEQTVEEIAEKKRRASEAAKRKAERVAELAALARSKPFTYGVQDHDATALLGGNGAAATTYVSGDVEVDEDTWRKQRGLCSTKQAKILARHGLNPHMKRWLARIAMDAIAENGWRLPDHIKADERFYRKRDVAADRAAADAALASLRGH